MAGQDYVDEIDCGNFFDQIDDLIEFPTVGDTGLSSDFPNVWAHNSGELQDSDPIFSGNNSHHSASDLSAQLAVPYEDIVQLEWLSNFVEDSFSGGGMMLNKENIPVKNEVVPTVPHSHFQTSSPVSVLESSSSSSSSSSCSGSGSGSVGKTVVPLGQTQRARSKRPRPAIFSPRPSFDVLSPQPSFIETPPTFFVPVTSSDLDGFVEPKKKKKKTKIKKSAPPVDSDDQKQNPAAAQQGVRKCLHCEITKTPQWRAGPLGPKTLCNACGVRYKSGRLFPEYRPAASPTFVPAIHSNSHKKVLEMRTKGGEKTPSFVDNAACFVEPEPVLIPNSVEYMTRV